MPSALAKNVHECRRNRKENRASVLDVWRMWPQPFRQLSEDWDEVYLAAFHEVADEPAAVGSERWRKFYSFSRATLWLIQLCGFSSS